MLVRRYFQCRHVSTPVVWTTQCPSVWELPLQLHSRCTVWLSCWGFPRRGHSEPAELRAWRTGRSYLPRCPSWPPLSEPLCPSGKTPKCARAHTHTHVYQLFNSCLTMASTNWPIFNWDYFSYVQSVKVTQRWKIQGSNVTSCDRKLTYFKRVAWCHDFSGVCARACASSTSDDAIWRDRYWSVVHTGLQHHSFLYTSKQNLCLWSFEAHIWI